MSNTCEWKQAANLYDYDEGMCDWETECQHCFSFTEGGPIENNFEFCCYCSKPIKVVPYVAEVDDDDDERED